MLRTKPLRLSEIQLPIRAQLEAVIGELRRIVLSDFNVVQEVSDHLLWSRGKLFRPSLLLLSNRIGGSPHPQAITLAAVVELVHLATLVHDDAVDHSVLRRGMPTVNALWNHQTAVIMGDYLYSRSVSELARIGRVDLIAVLSGAANEMSVGELRQLASHDALAFTERDYDRLIASKTASLMSAACEMGAVAGPAAYREPLAKYGHALGMAFQIADDLLDYTAVEAEMGKPSGQDLREHKVTLPLIHALGTVSAAARGKIERFFAQPIATDEAIHEIIAIVEESGGLEYARERANRFGEQALAALSELPSEPTVDTLGEAVGYVINRKR